MFIALCRLKISYHNIHTAWAMKMFLFSLGFNLEMTNYMHNIRCCWFHMPKTIDAQDHCIKFLEVFISWQNFLANFDDFWAVVWVKKQNKNKPYTCKILFSHWWRLELARSPIEIFQNGQNNTIKYLHADKIVQA